MTKQLPSDWGQPTWGAKPVSNRPDPPTARPPAGTAPDVPPAAPPPGPARPPPPARAPRRRRRGLVGSVIAALALMVAVAAAAFVLVVMWVVAMARGPLEATNSFVADLDDGRLGAAYRSLCAETRLTYTLDEFIEQMSAAGSITGYTFVSASVRSDDETIVSGTIDLDDEPVAVDFGLKSEGDTWKVCSYDHIS